MSCDEELARLAREYLELDHRLDVVGQHIHRRLGELGLKKAYLPTIPATAEVWKYAGTRAAGVEELADERT